MKHLAYMFFLSFLLLFSACSSSKGSSSSSSATVLIADAGTDQNINTASTVTLDGSGSTNLNGGVLVYKWSFISTPAESTVSLSDASSVRPSFQPDLDGVYVLGLVVNDGKVESDADTVKIIATTANSAPVANAGPDQNVNTTSTVTLDGTGSSDADLDQLSYRWNLSSRPISSNASFMSDTIAKTTFVADLDGVYVAELVVNDGAVYSAIDTVIITASTANSTPVANAGADQKVKVTDTVTLDGSESFDADLDLLTYSWSLLSKPIESTTSLVEQTSDSPTFLVDNEGNYVVQLIVNDGTADSEPSTVTISTSSLNDLFMSIDVDEVSIQTDWKSASNAPLTSTATIKAQGQYGFFSINGDQLSYIKTVETNMSDAAVLDVLVSGINYDVVATVTALYWKKVSAGYSHTAAIKSDGTLWSWGDNRRGQLGNGTTVSTVTPTQESTRSSWKGVSTGQDFTAAIKSDGTLWAWGYNNIGQLGDGTEITKISPIQEETNATSWVNVTAGLNHTLAIRSDGTLWAWGSNGNGTLGDGTNISKSMPVQEVSYSNNWKSVNAGELHSVAIKGDGTLWSWGRNNEGELGIGTDETYKYRPTQEVSAAVDWIKVDAGSFHTAAIKSDGTLWEWGNDIYGTKRISPTQEVTNAQNWADVQTGSMHIAAAKSDGTLWLWGENGQGELGDGTHDSTLIPTQELSKATIWGNVSAKAANTFAIKSDGTLWGWGDNVYGQLGDSTKISKSEPVQSQAR